MNTNGMIPINDLLVVAEDASSLPSFAKVAQSFLLSHSWCLSISAGYLSYGWEEILGVFFFEIIPAKPEVDSQLWVISGDVPPAYLVCEFASVPSAALTEYVREMELWVQAVRVGKPVDNLIPVCYQNSTNRVQPTLEFANMLAGRLHSINQELVPEAKAVGL